jgi:agmatinase
MQSMTEKKKEYDDWFLNSQNFAGLPPQTETNAGQVVILPIPYEASTTYRPGCRLGPAAIIEASTNMELYDEELSSEPHLLGIVTSRPLEQADAPEEMIKRIERTVTAFLGEKKLVAALGGEHTITLGLVRAMARAYEDLTVLFLDAHADFRDSFHGNQLNHGCVARRVSETCGIAQAGVRSLSKEEADAMDAYRQEPLWAREFRSAGGRDERRKLVDRLLEKLSQTVYVSIDADVFDPSIMPAVGTPEPGGLLWDEVLDILEAVCKEKRVVGVDFVELAPIAGLVHPEFLAARLLYRIFGFLQKTKKTSMGF